jgi:hypothetical protein
MTIPDKRTIFKQDEPEIIIKGPTQEAIIDLKSRLDIIQETVSVF